MKLRREDFQQEGHNQWAAYKQGFRVIIRNFDGHYEIVIRAELKEDPTDEHWEEALKTVNMFYEHLRIGERIDMRTFDSERAPGHD